MHMTDTSFRESTVTTSEMSPLDSNTKEQEVTQSLSLMFPVTVVTMTKQK